LVCTKYRTGPALDKRQDSSCCGQKTGKVLPWKKGINAGHQVKERSKMPVKERQIKTRKDWDIGLNTRQKRPSPGYN
jgi:hypothetical protein